MLLNLGSGNHPAPSPWYNLDRTDMPSVDIVASATSLPIDDASVAGIYAGHVFEHLTWSEASEAVRECHRALVPGAQLMATGPDVLKALETGDAEIVYGAFHGAGRWAGDAHRWSCSAALLTVLLGSVFADVEVIPIELVPSDWPVVSRAPWQCAVLAIR